MNPVGYPAEVFPLREGYAFRPGQAGGPTFQPGGTVVQYTTVNIPPEPPRDHIIWSMLCLVYTNPFCLGLVALIYSIKARDRKMAGDMDGARHYGSTARCINIFATILGSIIILTILTISIIYVPIFLYLIQYKSMYMW
ncbi:dispanin subfamily A member 2b-like [Dicentrarchus labrax]|uniref:Interferon-induced transmembrane protein 3 n=1 Tax=Dicentrarchus labrax TaxID=13489 RepID=A0A8P4GAG2_DICLA|nr:dispanin subfamily A member 2b-like [Dicentrarchus labrax]